MRGEKGGNRGEGRRDGREGMQNLAPRPFLKVGAYEVRLQVSIAL